MEKRQSVSVLKHTIQVIQTILNMEASLPLLNVMQREKTRVGRKYRLIFLKSSLEI